jgi:formylglycine-generating enzyme required for sulfatase activity
VVAGTRPPTVAVLSPLDGSWAPPDQPLGLTALVADDATPPEKLVVGWLSDTQGSLGAVAPLSSGLAMTQAVLAPGKHVLTVRATDLDGMTGEASVIVRVNQAPSAPEVAITPAKATTADDLLAKVGVPAADPDRATEELIHQYTWSVDNAPAEVAGAKVPAAYTQRGQTWKVEVRAFDGYLTGPPGSAEVVIANTPPACRQATLLPSAVTRQEAVTCACADREDPDGDAPLGDGCQFLADGQPTLAEGCTLTPAALAVGTVLTCGYTPDDGTDAGQPAWSGQATVVNTVPTAPVVAIAPAAAGVSDMLACSIVAPATDADGDALSYQYEWLVTPQGGTAEQVNKEPAIAEVLAGALLSDPTTPARRGDIVRCAARAQDGGSTSAPGLSPPLVLGNSPPIGGVVLVQAVPAPAQEASLLSCLGSGATDPDADPVSWTDHRWVVDGAEIPEATGSPSLGGAWFGKGAKLTCRATPWDGQVGGPPVDSKNQVLIGNTPPEVSEVAVTPPETDQNGSFECAWKGWIDPDPGDPPEVDLAWELTLPDGTWVAPEQPGTAPLEALGLPKGTLVACRATPHNGLALGPAVVSPPAKLGNTLPTLGGAVITPATGEICAPFTCEVSGASDLDADDVVITLVGWTLNGKDLPVSTAWLGGVALEPGDNLACHARPSDGTLGPNGSPVYGPEVHADPVAIVNTPATVTLVSLTPPNPAPDATLTCEVTGWSDPDACQTTPTPSFKWWVNGTPIDGSSTFEAASWPTGTLVACQAALHDGHLLGPGKLSKTVEIQASEPVVALSAPLGADGPVECALVNPGAFAQPPAYAYSWAVNGKEPYPFGSTLAADTVRHCDLLECWVTATSAGETYTSNHALLQLGFGGDCSDATVCTADACAVGGGCSHADVAWGACDDGNPCTLGEGCEEGACLGGVSNPCDDGNLCTADSCAPPQGCQQAPVAGPCAGGAGFCLDGICCVPNCQGAAPLGPSAECGPDGCGGTCGTCTDPDTLCDASAGLCIGPGEEMTVVWEGYFWMGGGGNILPSALYYEMGADGEPIKVWLSTYAIDLFEVTVAAYTACVADWGCQPSGQSAGCTSQIPGGGAYPINCVRWQDAVDYCTWDGKRLCTEAQWEKAARGDDPTDPRAYPWGDTAPTSCAWAVAEYGSPGCGTGGPWAVGSIPAGASPFGLFDMAGNLDEWTSNWFSTNYYLVGPSVDPPGPTAPDGPEWRVGRGGGYPDLAQQLPVFRRHHVDPKTPWLAVGFRCCKDFPP